MKFVFPDEILEVYRKFEKDGHQIYFVGGCVRNILLEKEPKDWDFATSAKPEEILKLFPNGFYDNKFGTVGIPTEKYGVVEVTTFRTEQGYKDRRRPEKVTWGKTIDEDLARRDFTINAIALKLKDSADFEIIDPYEGQKDLKSKLIRAVGDPSKRFKEDALRLMRAIRLSTQLNFKIEEKTLAEIKSDSGLLKEISKERIRDEFLKILASDNAYEGLLLLRETGLLEHIIPELLEGVGVSQERPGRHHTDDVFTHNLLSLKLTPSKDPIVRFATLIHDVGKPRVAGKDKEGLVIFHNHEIEGARVAREICERLKFSKKDREKVVNLVRWHMFSVDEHITDAAIRRFIRRVGVADVRDMIDLRIGDRLGSGTETAESWRLKKFKERIAGELAPKPFSMNDLAIDGNDLMKEFGMKPGPKIGEILQKLFDYVDEDLSRNKKEHLLEKAKELV
jgi:tRNA nucleotidyltransferase (CCA-adding enzyme)